MMQIVEEGDSHRLRFHLADEEGGQVSGAVGGVVPKKALSFKLRRRIV